MSQDPTTIVHRWFEEVWNQRRAQTIDELLTPESVCHGEGDPIRGPGEFRERMHDPLLAAFPDVRVTVEATLADGDEVVVRWRAEAAHAGPGLGFPATGRPVVFRGMTWIRVSGGRFVQAWQSSNIAEVIRSLTEPSPA
jgi:steroid delta-isomerase-like uncharacterized protein